MGSHQLFSVSKGVFPISLCRDCSLSFAFGGFKINMDWQNSSANPYLSCNLKVQFLSQFFN